MLSHTVRGVASALILTLLRIIHLFLLINFFPFACRGAEIFLVMKQTVAPPMTLAEIEVLVFSCQTSPSSLDRMPPLSGLCRLTCGPDSRSDGLSELPATCHAHSFVPCFNPEHPDLCGS